MADDGGAAALGDLLHALDPERLWGGGRGDVKDRYEKGRGRGGQGLPSPRGGRGEVPNPSLGPFSLISLST